MKGNKLTSMAFLLLLLFSITSCHKAHTWMNNATIVGWNYGACATCGGFYLNLSSDTTISAKTYYVINYSDALTGEIANLFAQYNERHSPIYVSVDWQPAAVSNPNNSQIWIRVTAIRAR